MKIAIIGRGKSATLTRAEADKSFELDGELFVAHSPEPDWFGFYDWLRLSNGDVIGVRLQLDEPLPIDDERFEMLRAVDPRNSTDELYLFFGIDREFVPALSDDADFGGNILYIGNLGSVALAFNSPVERRP